MHRFTLHPTSLMILLVGVMLLEPLLVACGGPSTPPQAPPKASSQVCDNGQCLAYADWAAGIDNAIDQQAVGYTYLILDHGRVVASKTFGLARTAADPPAVALSPDDSMNIASVSKTLTAVAALKLLAARHVSVDTPIYTYLPKSWTLGPNSKTITFRELLTHTSGIRSSQSLATGYDDLRTLIAQGIKLSDKVYYYQNQNFALFRILIPYLNGFDDRGVTDIGVQTSQLYLGYMNSVYDKYFYVTCDPDEGTGTPILSYPYPALESNGIDWGDETAICGAGGLQLSVDEMGVFLTQLNSGAFLTADQLQQMYDNLFGWDYLFDNTRHGQCLTKPGLLTNDVALLSTLLVYCRTTGLGFVGLANSTLGSATYAHNGLPGSWDDIVQDAYNAAWKP
jgi:CubicO group peptidase (beta-lactamase class C family)